MNKTADLFGDVLNEMANGPRITDFDAMTQALLTRMSEKGATLEQLTGPRFLGRPVEKLRSFCNRFGIAFPDYVPPQLRETVHYSVRKGVTTVTGTRAETIAALIGFEATSFPVSYLREHKTAIQFAGFEMRRVKAEKLDG